MKTQDAMPYDHSAVIVRDGDSGYEVLYYNRLIGVAKIGPRLKRSGNFPDMPTKASTYSEADGLREKWQAWLDETKIITRRKGARS